MNIGAPNVHLTYCSNIHPGEAWADVRANIEKYYPAVRDEVAPGQAFGVGLRLSGRAAKELATRIDDAEIDTAPVKFCLQAIPRGARNLVCDRHTLSHQPVEQHTFADIGTPDQSDQWFSRHSCLTIPEL